MSALATDTVRVSLEADHDGVCGDLAGPLLLQLSRGYEECAVLPVTSVEEWRLENRTARKRADRAARRGYRFTTLRRHTRVDEIHRINISASHRQGRPMSPGYRARPSDTPLPDYPCSRHAVYTYGVETADGLLVAYLSLYRAGDLALVSQILGHADHLEDEIMFLLVQGALFKEQPRGGFMVYNRWDSGTDGLRLNKTLLGFTPMEVEWAP